MSMAPAPSGAVGQNARINGGSKRETCLMLMRYDPFLGIFSLPIILTLATRRKTNLKIGRMTLLAIRLPMGTVYPLIFRGPDLLPAQGPDRRRAHLNIECGHPPPGVEARPCGVNQSDRVCAWHGEFDHNPLAHHAGAAPQNGGGAGPPHKP